MKFMLAICSRVVVQYKVANGVAEYTGTDTFDLLIQKYDEIRWNVY